MSSYQESSLHRMVKALEDEYYLYNSVKEPSAVVRDIERDPQKLALLYSALNRQVDRIRSRSQSFADGHITVFDKVLLNLFDSRGAYGTTGLCELFVNEYIGINHSGSIDENIKMVSSYVEAQKALDNSLFFSSRALFSHQANMFGSWHFWPGRPKPKSLSQP